MDAPEPPKPPKGFEPEEPLYVPDWSTYPEPPKAEAPTTINGWVGLLDPEGVELIDLDYRRQPVRLVIMREGHFENIERVVFHVLEEHYVTGWALYTESTGGFPIVPPGQLVVYVLIRGGDTIEFQVGHLQLDVT